MRELLPLVLVLVTVLAIFAIDALVKSNKRKKAVNPALATIHNFSPTYKYYQNKPGGTGIALDERNELVCLLAISKHYVETRLIAYSDILSSEIFENGKTVIKTDRVSQISSAVIGGMLFGESGAIIGGLSSGTTTMQGVSRIELRLIINDSSAPLYDICFLNTPFKIDRSSSRYIKAFDMAREWHARMKIAIETSEREAESERQNAEPAAVFSVSDEIMKLFKLKEAGILTEAEFVKQKAKLLES